MRQKRRRRNRDEFPHFHHQQTDDPDSTELLYTARHSTLESEVPDPIRDRSFENILLYG